MICSSRSPFLSFVTACVHPARVLMTNLLNSFLLHRTSRMCPLPAINISDFSWCCHLLSHPTMVCLSSKLRPGLMTAFFNSVTSTDPCSNRYQRLCFPFLLTPGAIITDFTSTPHFPDAIFSTAMDTTLTSWSS